VPIAEWLKALPLVRPLRQALSRANQLGQRAVYAAHHSAIRQRPWTKLQLGCGPNLLGGWLNTDVLPSRDVVFVDATQRLPFPDSQFQYVFTEHMIEHLPIRLGSCMLAEINRVLCPGGKLRIATPDFGFLLRLCRQDISPQEQEYIVWATKAFRPDLPPCATSVVNNFFRDWGHRYIYDQSILSQSLSSSGFGEIIRCEVGHSNDPELCGLECHGKLIGEANNRLETMVLEATKPH
jgi:predicted SAM-dependent methyltransferase